MVSIDRAWDLLNQVADVLGEDEVLSALWDASTTVSRRAEKAFLLGEGIWPQGES